MADPRFFNRAGPLTLEALAVLSGARLLDRGQEDVSFLENRKYIETFVHSRAGAAFIDESAADRAPPGMALLVSREPYKAYALAAQAFYPAIQLVPHRAPSAIIDP